MRISKVKRILQNSLSRKCLCVSYYSTLLEMTKSVEILNEHECVYVITKNGYVHTTCQNRLYIHQLSRIIYSTIGWHSTPSLCDGVLCQPSTCRHSTPSQRIHQSSLLLTSNVHAFSNFSPSTYKSMHHNLIHTPLVRSCNVLPAINSPIVKLSYYVWSME